MANMQWRPVTGEGRLENEGITKEMIGKPKKVFLHTIEEFWRIDGVIFKVVKDLNYESLQMGSCLI